MLTEFDNDTILLVDDEPQILSSLEDLLEDEFVVLQASNAEDALKLLEKNEVAVIVTDQRMPGTQGSEFLALAMEHSQAVRILITGYADLEAVVEAVNDGQIYAYVAKPWDPVELRLTVRRAAEHFRMVSELQRERDLLHALMDNSPDAIYFKDRDYRFVRVNQSQARQLGLTDPQTAVGKTESDFWLDQQAREELEDDKLLVSTGQPRLDQVRPNPGTKPEEDRWISSTKTPLKGANGKVYGLAAIVRDITDRYRTEQKLMAAQQQMLMVEGEKKRFYGEVLRAVTAGKLNLVDADELPHMGTPSDELNISTEVGYARMRHLLRGFSEQVGLSSDAKEDLVLACGEVAANAIKHAGGGNCKIYAESDSITVRIEDQGVGIRPEDLPANLLIPGHSTKISLGMGFTLLLELVDDIWLHTGPEGTVVQIRKFRQARVVETDALERALHRFGFNKK